MRNGVILLTQTEITNKRIVVNLNDVTINEFY